MSRPGHEQPPVPQQRAQLIAVGLLFLVRLLVPSCADKLGCALTRRAFVSPAWASHLWPGYVRSSR